LGALDESPRPGDRGIDPDLEIVVIDGAPMGE
jgi:hypothetical protein